MRAALLVLSMLGAASALAGEKPKKAEPTPLATPAAVSGMEGREPTDVVKFEAIVIEGRVQKPQALELLRRSDVSFADLVPEESLLPKILEAVESEPF